MQLDERREQLRVALLSNGDKGTAILMDEQDTTFTGSSDEVSDNEVIQAIKSVPTHY